MRTSVAIAYNAPDSGRYGDLGEERAVLGVLDEVEAVQAALDELGYDAFQLPLRPPIELARAQLKGVEADLVFNLFEGFEGRPETEWILAQALSELGIAHTGCPGPALSVALDKVRAKEVLIAAGVPTPRFQLMDCETATSFRLDLPCIVKPPAEDASHGITTESVVYDRGSLERQIARVCRLYGGSAFVEEYVDGREFNALVVGGREPAVLPITEIVYTLPPDMPRILTFAAKWQKGSDYYRCSEAVCPAEIEARLRGRIEDIAASVFKLFGCRGYARIDFRLDAAGEPVVIDVNPNPDISWDSGAARQVQAAGMGYPSFVEKIVRVALE